MNINAIKEALKREPFNPFAVNTSDGKTFVVNHPELVIMTKVAMFIFPADEHGGLPDLPVSVSYLHISSLTPLPAAA